MKRTWIVYWVGRDSRTGRFVSLATAERRKATCEIQRVRYWRAR